MGYFIGSLIGTTIMCVVFGFISRYINESKGYDGGFAWGFWLGVIGIIVVACKQPVPRYDYYAPRREPLDTTPINGDYTGGRSAPAYSNSPPPPPPGPNTWRCVKCGASNPDYLTTCACGLSKKDSDSGAYVPPPKNARADVPGDVADAIRHWHDLVEEGLLTEEEFQAKKKQILRL